ncbi:MAG: DUF6526 family protein [Bryobacteraceae bacterium]
MSEKRPQTYANHTRIDPPYHFLVFPVVAAWLVISVVNLIRTPSLWSAWIVVTVAAAIVAALRARMYALRAQDRVIRLEERLRLEGVLPAPLRARIGELTERQLVGLRFAPDGELPALVEQALANNWGGAEIKKAIAVWRPDYFRV